MNFVNEHDYLKPKGHAIQSHIDAVGVIVFSPNLAQAMKPKFVIAQTFFYQVHNLVGTTENFGGGISFKKNC